MLTTAEGSTLIKMAAEVARKKTKQASGDTAREVTSETIYQVLKTISNNGPDKKTDALQRKYVAAVAQHVYAVMAGRGHSSHSQAVARFISLRAAMEQAEGRTVTESEEDVLADSIRLSILAKHRPPEGYHRRNDIPTTLHRVEVMNQVDMRSWSLVAGAGPERPVTLVDEMLRLMSTGVVTPSQAKKTVWDVLASAHGAPRVVRSIALFRVARVQAEIRREGGVTPLMHRWEHGCPDATRLLTVPFGDLSRHGQREVVEMLRSVAPGHRDQLFFAALRAAVKPPSTRSADS